MSIFDGKKFSDKVKLIEQSPAKPSSALEVSPLLDQRFSRIQAQHFLLHYHLPSNQILTFAFCLN